MKQNQLNTSNNNNQELYVITRTTTGFSIYSMESPFEEYKIRENEQCITCTCKDYASHHTITAYQCKHIKAVHDLWDVPYDVELQSFI